jgi:hypothetical protein
MTGCLLAEGAMRVEQVQKLSKTELRAKANACFAEAELPGYDRAPLLFEAQFYMREIEHRSDSRVSIRDFILEIVVIALIGWEIHMGYQQERQQARAFEQEQAIRANMETSSRATAATLDSLAGTTSAMNTALQKQLALYYEISVTPVWDASTKKITIANTGRTNIALWGSKFYDQPVRIEDSRMIAPSGTYIIAADSLYSILVQRVPKGSNQFIPLDLYIRNDRREEFTEHCLIGTSWTNDTLNLGLQIVSVEPEHWSKSITNKQK